VWGESCVTHTLMAVVRTNSTTFVRAGGARKRYVTKLRNTEVKKIIYNIVDGREGFVYNLLE
jgi:hypothetical protein